MWKTVPATLAIPSTACSPTCCSLLSPRTITDSKVRRRATGTGPGNTAITGSKVRREKEALGSALSKSLSGERGREQAERSMECCGNLLDSDDDGDDNASSCFRAIVKGPFHSFHLWLRRGGVLIHFHNISRCVIIIIIIIIINNNIDIIIIVFPFIMIYISSFGLFSIE